GLGSKWHTSIDDLYRDRDLRRTACCARLATGGQHALCARKHDRSRFDHAKWWLPLCARRPDEFGHYIDHFVQGAERRWILEWRVAACQLATKRFSAGGAGLFTGSRPRWFPLCDWWTR